MADIVKGGGEGGGKTALCESFDCAQDDGFKKVALEPPPMVPVKIECAAFLHNVVIVASAL
jgi:hypothetical protein